MRFLIWGAGAIGGTMGAYLARAGRDVTLVDTVDEHVSAIRRSGLRITGPLAEFTQDVPAFIRLRSAANGTRSCWPPRRITRVPRCARSCRI
jgi:ketopantoate reductase